MWAAFWGHFSFSGVTFAAHRESLGSLLEHTRSIFYFPTATCAEMCHPRRPNMIVSEIPSTFGTHFRVMCWTCSEKIHIVVVLFLVLFQSHVFRCCLVIFGKWEVTHIAKSWEGRSKSSILEKCTNDVWSQSSSQFRRHFGTGNRLKIKCFTKQTLQPIYRKKSTPKSQTSLGAHYWQAGKLPELLPRVRAFSKKHNLSNSSNKKQEFEQQFNTCRGCCKRKQWTGCAKCKMFIQIVESCYGISSNSLQCCKWWTHLNSQTEFKLKQCVERLNTLFDLLIHLKSKITLIWIECLPKYICNQLSSLSFKTHDPTRLGPMNAWRFLFRARAGPWSEKHLEHMQRCANRQSSTGSHRLKGFMKGPHNPWLMPQSDLVTSQGLLLHVPSAATLRFRCQWHVQPFFFISDIARSFPLCAYACAVVDAPVTLQGNKALVVLFFVFVGEVASCPTKY